MGEAKRRKQLDPNYGKSIQKNIIASRTNIIFDEEESSFYDNNPELLKYVNDLKAENMNLQQFKERFGEELNRIEIITVNITSVSKGVLTKYEGTGLALNYRGSNGPSDLFPFPGIDKNNDAPIPPDVFDYLAGYWL